MTAGGGREKKGELAFAWRGLVLRAKRCLCVVTLSLDCIGASVPKHQAFISFNFQRTNMCAVCAIVTQHRLHVVGWA